MKFSLKALKKLFIEDETTEPVQPLEEIAEADSEAEKPVAEPLPEPEPEPEPEAEPVLLQIAEFRASIDVAEQLMNGTPVFLDLGVIDYALAKRTLDFLGGVIYVLHGTLKQVADSVFYLTPTADAKDAEELKSIYDRLCM